jgi:hypothetical protein
VPDFIVLQTASPAGTQRVWTELFRGPADEPGEAFVAGAPSMAPGDYLVLSLEEQFTATVQITVTKRDAAESKAAEKAIRGT